jgi:hypothetical protein
LSFVFVFSVKEPYDEAPKQKQKQKQANTPFTPITEQDLININITQASQPHSQSYSHTIAKGIGAWLPAPLEQPAQMTTSPVQNWSEMTMTNGGSGQQQTPGVSAIYEMLQLVEGHRDEMYAERWMLAGSGSGTSVGGSHS